MQQKEFFEINKLPDILSKKDIKNIFLVTGIKSYESCKNKINLDQYNITHFQEFSKNPKLDDVIKGINLYGNQQDLTIAIGGGSVIDMAKLINFFANQKINPLDFIEGDNKIKNEKKELIAIPTTSGSGSEATQFAVMYVNEKKYSISNKLILPDYVILDASLTLSMPDSIKAITGMDALSQAIESYWSINSTKESEEYSINAIKLIINNLQESIHKKTKSSIENMIKAANLAGKAINIAKTTAPHALSYILTSKFKIPHGQAVALTLGEFLEFNSQINEDNCNDKRGHSYVNNKLNNLLQLLNCQNFDEANNKIKEIMQDINLETNLIKLNIKEKDIQEIIKNINYERLDNNPRKVKKTDLTKILLNIL